MLRTGKTAILLTMVTLLLTIPGGPAVAKGGEREKTLDAICKLVRTEFHDPGFNGIDWNTECELARAGLTGLSVAAFNDRLRNLVAKLGTSHTGYLEPSDWRLAVLAQVFENSPQVDELAKLHGGMPVMRGSGYWTVQIDGREFVDVVLPGSPAEEAGLLPGDEVLSSGGSHFVAVWPDSRATAATSAKVRFRREKGGETRTIDVGIKENGGLNWLADATQKSVKVLEAGGRKIGYLRGWTMLSREGLGGPAAELGNALGSKIFEDIDAMVFDARGMVGGGGLDVLEKWLAPRVGVAVKTRNSGGWLMQAPVAASTPLVVVIDNHTRSSAEIFAYVTKNHGIAPLVGSQTAGAVTGGSLFSLPDGGALYLAVVEIKVEGQSLEGSGVSPTIAVNRPIPYSRGKDPQLDAAILEAVRRARDLSKADK